MHVVTWAVAPYCVDNYSQVVIRSTKWPLRWWGPNSLSVLAISSQRKDRIQLLRQKQLARERTVRRLHGFLLCVSLGFERSGNHYTCPGKSHIPNSWHLTHSVIDVIRCKHDPWVHIVQLKSKGLCMGRWETFMIFFPTSFLQLPECWTTTWHKNCPCLYAILQFSWKKASHAWLYLQIRRFMPAWSALLNCEH